MTKLKTCNMNKEFHFLAEKPYSEMLLENLAVHDTYSGISFKNRLRILLGVFRRSAFFLFHRKYVNENIIKRKGKCLKCGACCRLFFRKCNYLKINENGTIECRIYNSFRMPNCIIFPVNLDDIKDRNIDAKSPCGYSFEEENT